MDLLGCRATSVCANRNGRTYCLMSVLACTEPGPALSVQAGFGLWIFSPWHGWWYLLQWDGVCREAPGWDISWDITCLLVLTATQGMCYLLADIWINW